jgi:hypothetical protein
VPVVILIVVVLVVIVAGLVTWVRRGRSASRLVGAPASEREAVFHGGIMCKSLTTSGLLVKF